MLWFWTYPGDFLTSIAIEYRFELWKRRLLAVCGFVFGLAMGVFAGSLQGLLVALFLTYLLGFYVDAVEPNRQEHIRLQDWFQPTVWGGLIGLLLVLGIWFFQPIFR